MKILEISKLTPETFINLEEEKEPASHSLKEENESFMDFVRKGSEQIKENPIIINVL